MNRDVLLEQLDQGLTSMDLSLTSDLQFKLIDYLQLLCKWNRAFNLTAVRDVEEMVSRHLLDSLSVRPFLSGKRFIDVGSGAGLPGIVLAISTPDTQWVLLDSNLKKTRFLQQVAIEIGLKNVEVVYSRAEDYIDDTGFDMATSRAVADLVTLISRMGHLSECLLAMKGQIPDNELNVLPEHWRSEIVQISVPGLQAQRSIIILNKDYQ